MIETKRDEILFKNAVDIEAAENLAQHVKDRLTLNAKRISEVVDGLKEIALLPDPVGEVISEWVRDYDDKKMKIKKVRVPLGVIFVIYEARPSVTVEAAAIAIKSSNAVILRGGSEALSTNMAFVEIIGRVLKDYGIENAVRYVPTTERSVIYELLKMNDLIDLVIPRGSEEMINEIVSASKIPVLGHGKGNCMIYVDDEADILMALNICFNAKTNRPSTCNAVEKILVNRKIANSFLPELYKILAPKGVVFRCDEESLKIIDGSPADEDDWYEEYLDLKVGIKIVGSVEEAVDFINKYSSHHTDAIITENIKKWEYFSKFVDSSCVILNASTRIHDGGVFGLGAEVGISTSRIHARGTMGIRELTTTKYIVEGSGHLRK